MAKECLRFISPSGYPGSAPTKEESFKTGAVTRPGCCRCDSGSDDIGPVLRGTDKCAALRWEDPGRGGIS